jgi:hypothetical protein
MRTELDYLMEAMLELPPNTILTIEVMQKLIKRSSALHWAEQIRIEQEMDEASGSGQWR